MRVRLAVLGDFGENRAKKSGRRNALSRGNSLDLDTTKCMLLDGYGREEWSRAGGSYGVTLRTLKIGSNGLFGGAHRPGTTNKMPSTAQRIPDFSMPSDER
jgi:hypothetical protein